MKWLFFLQMISKGQWGQVIFVEMDPFSLDNICSRARGRQQTAVFTGGQGGRVSDDKAYCPSVSGGHVQLSTALYNTLAPMVLCPRMKMSQWSRLERVTWQQQVKAIVSNLQAHSIGSHRLTQRHSTAALFSSLNPLYFGASSLFPARETEIDQSCSVASVRIIVYCLHFNGSEAWLECFEIQNLLKLRKAHLLHSGRVVIKFRQAIPPLYVSVCL